jgi:hypothetical protein
MSLKLTTIPKNGSEIEKETEGTDRPAIDGTDDQQGTGELALESRSAILPRKSPVVKLFCDILWILSRTRNRHKSYGK